jgi:hypothetical protein
LHPEVEGTSGLFHEGWADEDLPEASQEGVEVCELVVMVD